MNDDGAPEKSQCSVGSTAFRLVLKPSGALEKYAWVGVPEAFSNVVDRTLPERTLITACPVPGEGDRSGLLPKCRTTRRPIGDGRAIPSTLRKVGTTMTIGKDPPGVAGGVDSHLDNHVTAPLDPLGRLVGTESFWANVFCAGRRPREVANADYCISKLVGALI